MAISNYDIEKVCQKLKMDCIGVFSKDELPKDKKVGSYFVNMEDADDGNGTHWVFFKLFPNAKFIYFDSFGLPPPTDVIDWSSMFKPIATNNRQIQDVKSTKCGWFCLALNYYFTYECKCKEVDDDYNDFLNIWSNNPKQNDIILKEYLNNNTINI
jgi:hypothetical protein